MRIAFLMLRHKRESRIFPEVMQRLAARTVHVDVIYPEEQMFDLSRVRVEHDLYVLKAKSEFSLSVAAALHSAGAQIVNSHPASLALRDKIVTSRIMLAAGIPAPATYATMHPGDLFPLVSQAPMVVKPYRGSQGAGVKVVRNADELASAAVEGEIIFAQRYHAPETGDHKIYRIGDRIFGVKRVWPPRTIEEKLGASLELSPAMEQIALQCGEAFGIDLYGVDIIESEGRPYVVDMSSLPGFKGVPNAALHLAEYFYSAAIRARHGEIRSAAPLTNRLRMAEGMA